MWALRLWHTCCYTSRGLQSTRKVIPMPAKEILNLPNPEEIRAAAEKLFGKDKSGVKRFERSGVCYVEMPGDLIFVEQNTHKDSHWAKLAREGHKVAWLM